MQLKRVFSHADIRVRDRTAASTYYDKLLGALGMTGSYGNEWYSYSYYGDDDPAIPAEWFAFTEDPAGVPGSNRIAFAAASRADVDRMATVAREIGSHAVEGPEYAYGPEYYALFFEDPDGNRLEICYIGK